MESWWGHHKPCMSGQATIWVFDIFSHVIKVTYIVMRFYNPREITEARFHILNSFPNKPWFLRVCSTSILKTLWEKEKLLVTSNFSFSHNVLYLFGEFSAIVIKIWNCHLQSLSVWKSLKFVVWERVNPPLCLLNPFPNDRF